jgi:adenylate cyclase
MSTVKNDLSVLFAAVSGFAQLHEKLGSDEALRAVDRCLKRMLRAVEVSGGRLIKSAGNELMAVFNQADQAFLAAREMQQRVADLPPVAGQKLTIRVGFAHGPVSEDRGRVLGATVNSAAHLAGLARPGQSLTSGEAQLRLSAQLKQSTKALGPVSVNDPFPGMIVFELVPLPAARRFAPLTLRYGKQFAVLNDGSISMGRDAQSDIEIHDRRASRQHAKIERRGDLVFLIDSSTNGTYVTLDGEPELFLRGDECEIHGKGLICFAASADSSGADCAQFEQAGPWQG